jgi:hypothetical protein
MNDMAEVTSPVTLITCIVIAITTHSLIAIHTPKALVAVISLNQHVQLNMD